MSGSFGEYFKPIESKEVTAASAAKNIRNELLRNENGDASAASLQFCKEVYEFRRKNTGENKAKIRQFVGQVEKQLDRSTLHVLKKYAECYASVNPGVNDSSMQLLLDSDTPRHGWRAEETHARWNKKSLTELKQEAVRENSLLLHHAQPGQRTDWHSLAAELSEHARSSAPRFAMYGDSITAAMKSPATRRAFQATFGEDAENLGIPGDTTENLAYRLLHGEANFKSGSQLRQIVVLIGTNDLLHNKQPTQIAIDALADARFLAEKFPKANVLLLGLLPRGHHMQEVNAVNECLQRYSKAAVDKNLHFADIGSSMFPLWL